MYRNASTVYDTERAQAGVRMIFMSVAACYIVILYHFSLIDPALVWKIFVLECVFSVVATLIWFDIRRRPGNYRGRRLITMPVSYTHLTLPTNREV